MTIRIWMLLPPFLAACGAGLLAHSGLHAAVALGQGWRRGRGRRLAWHSDATGATVTLEGRRICLTWPALFPLGGGLVLALLWRDGILSAWSLLLGLAATVTLYLSEPEATAERRATEEVFLAAFRSRYTVNRSLGAALQGALADLGASAPPALQQAVTQAIQRLYTGEATGPALAGLAAYSRLFTRLVTLLQRSHQAAQDETDVLLDTLEEQARHSRRLAERARVALTVVRLTLHVLVAANSTALLVIPLLPAWRQHYLADPATYLAGSTLALAGFGYFRFKIKRLEESL